MLSVKADIKIIVILATDIFNILRTPEQRVLIVTKSQQYILKLDLTIAIKFTDGFIILLRFTLTLIFIGVSTDYSCGNTVPKRFPQLSGKNLIVSERHATHLTLR